MYVPRPVETEHVVLPRQIDFITELLARNIHDLWSQLRIAEGWTYGAVRDDAAKTHPNLVPYEELSESEKTFDRTTAIETLKTIVSIGCRIEPAANLSSALPGPSSAEADRAMAILDRGSGANLAQLLALWRTLASEREARAPEVYRRLGDQILKAGEPLLAYEVLTRGLENSPKDLQLLQLLALALARSGATEQAHRLLLQLTNEGHCDEETLGLLARTYKDLAKLATDPTQAHALLDLAHRVYARAYGLTKGYWTGINTAATALLLDQDDYAKAVAREVRQLCMDELHRLEQTGGDPYWVRASLGEAALVLGQPPRLKTGIRARQPRRRRDTPISVPRGVMRAS